MHTVTLRITTMQPPQASRGTIFGLVDKQGGMLTGDADDKGSITLQVAATVRTSDGVVRFSGPYLHGTADRRFLYFGLKPTLGGAWIRRWKIALDGITENQVAALSDSDSFDLVVDSNEFNGVWIRGSGWVATAAAEYEPTSIPVMP